MTYRGADALEWNEAMFLVTCLMDEGRHRDAMLIAAGCYLGLRISDLLTLRWRDILAMETITIQEKKTEKKRMLRINAHLREIAAACHDEMFIKKDDAYIFSSKINRRRPMTRQRAAQIVKGCISEHCDAKGRRFSTHTLRKTFGRRVWLQECEKGRGEQALLLLCDVFGHSSVSITKRYLGIRQDEILSVYDSLS